MIATITIGFNFDTCVSHAEEKGIATGSVLTKLKFVDARKTGPFCRPSWNSRGLGFLVQDRCRPRISRGLGFLIQARFRSGISIYRGLGTTS